MMVVYIHLYRLLGIGCTLVEDKKLSFSIGIGLYCACLSISVNLAPQFNKY
ncbi:hypothetical protein Mapa_017177 [Marchantia paleacea]|nr:hypothetical protein Mapa_017177 [Marchantia paleacea]